jgi:hypothetical protein
MMLQVQSMSIMSQLKNKSNKKLKPISLGFKRHLHPSPTHLLMSSDESTKAISSWPRPTTYLPAGVPVCVS